MASMTSTFVNKYDPTTAPIGGDIHRYTPQDGYDFNFVFPVKTLRSDRVELRPFVPSLHADLLWDGVKDQLAEITRFVSDFNSVEDILVWHEKTFRSNPGFLYHAIYTLPTGPGRGEGAAYEFAGVIGMNNASREDMSAELGWIMILPRFQRTHVLTHAAGTMIHRILDDPSAGGLGLRRCQWLTNSMHTRSQGAALRLGFTHEGIIRAHRVLAPGKEGIRKGRPGEREELKSRDTWISSILWDEWEAGKREHVDGLMARR